MKVKILVFSFKNEGGEKEGFWYIFENPKKRKDFLICFYKFSLI